MTDQSTQLLHNKRFGANRLAHRALGTSVLLGLPIALIAACSDDTDSSRLNNLRGAGTGGSSAGTGGSSAGTGGSAGTDRPDASTTAGRGGSAAVGGVTDAGGLNDGGGPDRDVFRPEEIAPTPALVAGLQVPAGFRVNVFADELQHARMLAVRGQDVYLTRPQQGDVLRLRDADLDGVAEDRVTVASGLAQVHGITFRGSDVYLATPNQVFRATVDGQGAFGTPTVLIGDLPDGGQHGNRTLGIGPDDALYISVGSSCDACRETDEEHATLLRANADGSQRSVFASGLRNTIGFGWHPSTGVLWGMDHGSDFRGDDIPPEELNRIVAGSDYGWPYCFGQRQVDPIIQDPPDTTKAAYCATTAPAVLETQAHNAPIGLAFYTADAFPVEYRNDAFVALRGSWNRFPPAGYKIVRIEFDDAGEPQRFEDFVSGFLSTDGTTTFARPAGITVGPDGALLFTDDSNGVIYRVSPAQSADAGVDAGVDAAADAADAGF